MGEGKIQSIGSAQTQAARTDLRRIGCLPGALIHERDKELDMQDDREARIRERAHAIWEAEGRPEGQERAHWERAIAEIDAAEDGGGVDVDPGKPDVLKQTSAIR